MGTVLSHQPLPKVTFVFVRLDIPVIIVKSIPAAQHHVIMAVNVPRTEMGLFARVHQDSVDQHVTQLLVIIVLA